MHINDYIDEKSLAEYIREGLVEARDHKSLPLRIYVHTRNAVQAQFWDEITTKCRGLIVDKHTGQVLARPYEKFFNVNTNFRPETLLSALPLTQPSITEKLDGSLGIWYAWDGNQGIATKGSFHSDQAEWATEWYNRYHADAVWPTGWTPIFEIIAESVQHHVVHYNGIERLVLLSLINNETGEEMDHQGVIDLGFQNIFEVTKAYDKSLGDVLNEDRKNAEGYVVSWPRPGKPPLKIKVKHESFLALQKIVHEATPKAILAALRDGQAEVVNAWIGQSNEQLAAWVQKWVAQLNGKYATILLKNRLAVNIALSGCETRAQFAQVITEAAKQADMVYPSVCYALLDRKDHARVIWKYVEEAFKEQLSESFALVED